MKYPSSATQNSPEGSGLKTPGLLPLVLLLPNRVLLGPSYPFSQGLVTCSAAGVGTLSPHKEHPLVLGTIPILWRWSSRQSWTVSNLKSATAVLLGRCLIFSVYFAMSSYYLFWRSFLFCSPLLWCIFCFNSCCLLCSDISFAVLCLILDPFFAKRSACSLPHMWRYPL